jgi:hypothetical protein
VCTEIRFANKEGGEITSAGDVDRIFGSDTQWGLTREAVVELIDSGAGQENRNGQCWIGRPGCDGSASSSSERGRPRSRGVSTCLSA